LLPPVAGGSSSLEFLDPLFGMLDVRGIRRCVLDEPPVRLDGLFEAPGPLTGQSLVQVGFSILRINRYNPRVVANGLIMEAFCLVGISPVEVGQGVLWIEFQGLRIVANSLVVEIPGLVGKTTVVVSSLVLPAVTGTS